MINKQVTIAKITTMADGSIRLYIDILNSNEEDIKAAYALREEETTMILAPTSVIENNLSNA